jgi:hypothetical protein
MLNRVADAKEHDAVLDLIETFARHDSEATQRLADRLDLSRHTQAAEIILSRLGTEEAFDRMEDYLRGAVQEGRRLTPTEMHIAIRLACSSERRTFAAELVWNDLQGLDPFRQSPWHFKAVAGLDIPEVQDRLLAEAIQASDHDFARPDIAVAAIRGLAKRDPDEAFRAAEHALMDLDPRQEDVPTLLLELGPIRAIPRLVEQAFREEQTWRFWQTGRALRKVGGNEALRSRLSAALRSPDPHQRARAVRLCGWIGSDFMAEELRRQALEDSAGEVRRSYLEASRRQRDQVYVRELLEAFATAEGLKRWSYLRSALEVGDPVLLARRGDPLCVWPFLDDAEGAFGLFAQSRLEERVKESQEAAKQVDSNRDWI